MPRSRKRKKATSTGKDLPLIIARVHGLTMPKKKIAHLPLNAYQIALCIVNYKKSVTVRKIFKNSSKLDQAECCNFFCFKMTTK